MKMILVAIVHSMFLASNAQAGGGQNTGNGGSGASKFVGISCTAIHQGIELSIALHGVEGKSRGLASLRIGSEKIWDGYRKWRVTAFSKPTETDPYRYLFIYSILGDDDSELLRLEFFDRREFKSGVVVHDRSEVLVSSCTIEVDDVFGN